MTVLHYSNLFSHFDFIKMNAYNLDFFCQQFSFKIGSRVLILIKINFEVN